MFLQAVSDDSMSQSGAKRLYLAGYLNYSDKWMLFENAWAEELATDPSIEYLKMSEAQNLKGQFRHWTEKMKNDKIISLSRVIRHFKPISFEISISVRDFNSIVKPVAPYGLATPYFPCLFGITSSVSRFMHEKGQKLPIQFIFDEQHGVSRDFQQYFNFMSRNIPAGARRLIKGTPIFRDDKSFLPLQAADMLAWHIRREHDEGVPQFRMPMAEHLRGEDHLVTDITYELIERWGDHFKSQKSLSQVQSKSQWKKFRHTMEEQLSTGYIPPYGTKWKNFYFMLRNLITNIIR